ncbi:FAS-associated factor [Acrasis kona]|uniref:FAS-associated factor n=1 Tax=Acrasis kona TaxID=1008807 RepID=A0AAW2ZRU4_9EUKA
MLKSTLSATSRLFLWLWSLFKSCFGYRIRNMYHPISQTPQGGIEMTEARRFQNKFDDEYGTIHPKFFNGDFKAALELIKKEYKMLLVYLHSPLHINTPRFCNEVLCKEGFKEFVEENFVFFAADISNREGYALSNQLRATTYPFLIAGVSTGGKFQPLLRLEGQLDMDSVMAQLIDAQENAEPTLNIAKAEDQERTMARTQREEQDRAYQASLERDRQLEIERQEKKDRELQVQRQIQEKQRLKEERLTRIQTERQALYEQFTSTPQSSLNKELTTIRFHFPDGSRAEYKFNKNDSNKRLFEYIHALPRTKFVAWEPRVDSDFENYEITTNFPKKAVDINATLAQSNLNNALLYVREIAQDEDEEV